MTRHLKDAYIRLSNHVRDNAQRLDEEFSTKHGKTKVQEQLHLDDNDWDDWGSWHADDDEEI